MERWKTAAGFDGILEVSDLGNVRRLARSVQNGKKIIQGGPHSQWLNAAGYKIVHVMIKGKREKAFVHRLVALAFVEGYATGLTVNHINGIKTRNSANNLEWITTAENTSLQWQTGLINIRGEKHPSAKLSDSSVMEILASTDSVHVLAKRYGVSISLVYKIKSGEKKGFLTTA